MPGQTERRIAELLRETEGAHGAYEADVLGGERDEDWPHWYASYLLDHGLGELLPSGANVDAPGLAARLVHLNDDYQREQEEQPWPTFYAARLTALPDSTNR